MNIEKYHLKADETLTVFEFISEGPSGPVRKLIHFQPTHTAGVYNLAFGDRNAQTDDIDDLAVTNNGDTDKVLGTVVAALYAFLDKQPEALVYATGSTRVRTRLYRMGISRFYAEIKQDFALFGQVGNAFHEFELGNEYDGFLVHRAF